MLKSSVIKEIHREVNTGAMEMPGPTEKTNGRKTEYEPRVEIEERNEMKEMKTEAPGPSVLAP